MNSSASPRPSKRLKLDGKEPSSLYADRPDQNQRNETTVKQEIDSSPTHLSTSRRLITSGTKRYAPYPPNCLKSCPEYKMNRSIWAKGHRKDLERLNLQKERILFRDDGLIIDWKSSVPVWSDTLEPDTSDLAATISQVHLANHHLGRQQQAQSSSRRTSPSPSNRSDTPSAYLRKGSNLPIPPRPLSARQSVVSRSPAWPAPTSSASPSPHFPLDLSRSRSEIDHTLPSPGVIRVSEAAASNLGSASPITFQHELSPIRTGIHPNTSNTVATPPPNDVSLLKSTLSNLPIPPVSALRESINHHSEVSAEQEMATMTENYLRQYIQTFDFDRASLASAYSRGAMFSYRVHNSLDVTGNVNRPSTPSPENIKRNRLDITTTLLSLTSHKFTPSSHSTHLKYDMMYLGEGLGMFVVCRGPLVDSADEQRQWMTHSFVLRKKADDEEDRSAEGVWPLVALSHQITIFEGESWH
ncbi:hypothetical protein BJ138DRAFT_1146561 [Hygrophoropsis aurantiaca]|uniref:Uncharacterized protein n=1 Tax=Hygrophoropsis aurantiaca TaxID=72124 RepID=A0ACB8AIJ5_9AGAM|nr:hypothetical protein BJ138DRAFT_1146561 [Hygrophoropsis aurantiaca]